MEKFDIKGGYINMTSAKETLKNVNISYQQIESNLENWAAVWVDENTGDLIALGSIEDMEFETVDDIQSQLEDKTTSFVAWYTAYKFIIKGPAQGASMYENNMLNLDKAKHFALQGRKEEFRKQLLELSQDELIALNIWFINHTKWEK